MRGVTFKSCLRCRSQSFKYRIDTVELRHPFPTSRTVVPILTASASRRVTRSWHSVGEKTTASVSAQRVEVELEGGDRNLEVVFDEHGGVDLADHADFLAVDHDGGGPAVDEGGMLGARGL